MASTARAAGKPLGRPEGSSGARTRARLLDVAATLFAKNGFAGVTLADVAGATGLTAPAIYNHFVSKDDLFIATVTRMYGEITAAFRAAIDPSDSWPANLDHILDAAESLYRDDGVLQRLGGVAKLEARKAPSRFEAIIEAERHSVETFVEMMTLAKQRGEIGEAIDARLAGELLAAMVLTGMATVASAHPSQAEFRALTRTFRALFLRGV